MAITVLPRNVNPWVAQLPQFVQQLAFQKISQKFQESQAEKTRKLEIESAKLGLDQAGYVEVDAEKPDVMYAGSGYKRPSTDTKFVDLGNGMVAPVTTQTRYGQQPQVSKVGTISKPSAEKFVTTDKGIMRWDPASRTLVSTGQNAPPKGSSPESLAAELEKSKQLANYKKGLENITVYNEALGKSRKMTRNEWLAAQKSGQTAGWNEIKNEKANLSEAELTRKALKGDKESKSILESMQERKLAIAKQTGSSAMDAKMSIIDIPNTASAILDGRENMENVKNTFGVAVQEAVRKEVMARDPKFNFNKPRVKLAAIKSSVTQQVKQRGMMGSFVKNLDKQLLRTDEVMNDVISRVGVRAIDLPIRELKTRFTGSGHEKVLEAYLIEISNEIGKLSTGSTASVRELSTEAQERWSKIHDPNLSLKELQIILNETQLMGQMRLESTDEEIEETLGQLDNIRTPRESKKEKQSGRFEILGVE